MGLFSFLSKYKKKIRIAIFISSRGSNMKAILENIKNKKLVGIEVGIVIADNADAKGLDIAKSYGVRAEFVDPTPFKTKLDGIAQQRVIQILKDENIDLICLAGFMRMVKEKLIGSYEGRIINVHPSLLPNFKGLNAQKQAIEAGVKESGCTIHFVDMGMDTGDIIAQRKVKVESDDTEKSLARKIIKQEHILYTEVLNNISSGKIKIPHSTKNNIYRN